MKQWITALKVFVVLSLLTGVIYPLAVTIVAQTTMSDKANGSLVQVGGKVVGSELIAQEFKDASFFHPRPSSVSYNPMPSGASNFGWTSQGMKDAVKKQREAGEDGETLFASASGLDPHIRPETALSQVERVSIARGLGQDGVSRLRTLIESQVEPRQFGIFGEPRVNVLKLNLRLTQSGW